jgi:endonuclease V-like protein UPF0215 family
MRQVKLSHVIGIDDAPFARTHRGDILMVGAVFSGVRLDGVLSGKVRRDGANATQRIARMIEESRFFSQLQLVLLQGIAVAGFNVVDIHALHRQLELPVMVVARKRPNMKAIHHALLTRVPGGARKWALVEKAGPMELLGGVFVQRAGLNITDASRVLNRLAVNSDIPEPLRTAHLIAGGVATGESRHRV